MNARTLHAYYNSKVSAYYELAMTCGSVSELMFRIEVIGSKWSKWDWILFLSFLDSDSSINSEKHHMSDLLEDILYTIDTDSRLDSVFTNKDIILNLILWLSCIRNTGRTFGICRILAHIFRKFPAMWNMNWMYIRHKGRNRKIERSHRLDYYIQYDGNDSDSSKCDEFIKRYLLFSED